MHAVKQRRKPRLPAKLTPDGGGGQPHTAETVRSQSDCLSEQPTQPYSSSFHRPRKSGALPRCTRRVRNVAKGSFFLLPVVLVSANASAQVLDEVSREPKSDFKTAFGGSSLTCFQPSTLVVPARVVERAKLKARLLFILLQDSLYDDAK